MPLKNALPYLVLLLLVSNITYAMQPFTIDWRDNQNALVDLSFLLEAPAGKDGHIRIENSHLVKPNGKRFRIWGINVTGAACFPSKEDAPVVADHLARFGINCIRFHFLDSNWSASLFVKERNDTRALDFEQLDRLDYFVAELKERGIYINLNLNVGRNYRQGDGVKDYEYLGLAKVVNYFDERVQMLHKEYSQQLLTHYNPYTKSEYRSEPAVIIVEIVNENSIVEAWFSDRLLGKNTQKRPGTWSDITAWYADQLTHKYNSWLKGCCSEIELNKLRAAAGLEEDELLPRLTKDEFNTTSKRRFHLEATFYMELEKNYFESMYQFLTKELGVKSLIAGTSDHNHYKTGYPLLASTSKLDVVDGHVYWQHPSYFTDPKTKRRSFSIPNTPMVDSPFNSTVVQLSRSAVQGKPYTVSETNHPFPSEYACEGIGILAAYSAFHDWDGIFFYTFEHKAPDQWETRMPGHFDIRSDPVKMMNLAVCALIFLRGDVRPAFETVPRAYSLEQVREGVRSPASERPYFTSGFSLALPLRHSTRITGFDQQMEHYPKAGRQSPIVSDTGELAWYHSERGQGLVAVETNKSQALIGFIKDNNKSLRNLSVEVDNTFCSIILTSLDGQSISNSERLLLVTTARSANTNMMWNDKRTSLSDWGIAPTVIEPVKGTVALRNLNPSEQAIIVPLNGSGQPSGEPVKAQDLDRGFTFTVGEPATPWYLVKIQR